MLVLFASYVFAKHTIITSDAQEFLSTNQLNLFKSITQSQSLLPGRAQELSCPSCQPLCPACKKRKAEKKLMKHMHEVLKKKHQYKSKEDDDVDQLVGKLVAKFLKSVREYIKKRN